MLDEDAFDGRVLDHRDAVALHERGQRQLDLQARLVATRAQHAAASVCALAAERDAPAVGVEAHAVTHEVGDAAGRVGAEHARGLLVDEARAGGDRVAQVLLGRVVLVDGGGDAALRVARVRLVDRAFGDDDGRRAPLARLQRDEQPGDTRADDQHVGAERAGRGRLRPGHGATRSTSTEGS